MPKTAKKRLGEILIKAGLITEAQIEEALDKQRKTGERLGSTLVELGYITEEKIIASLGEQLGLPHIDLDSYDIKPNILKIVPAAIAERYQLIPLEKVDKRLTIAVADPLNVFGIDEVRRITGCEVSPVVCSESALKKAIINCYYSGERRRGGISERVAPEKGPAVEITEDASTIKLIDSIVTQAVKERATDIHIEPEDDLVRVRFRVDGILHEIKTFSIDILSPAISRIKVMANLDIAEKRVPQDGRFSTKVMDREINVRVSTMPTVCGEKAALRVLDKGITMFGLDKLGFLPDALERFGQLIKKPYGMILVTGPTSSGKTTTLYAALNTIISMESHIMTIEDPVEYRLKLINQIQINPKAGLTFARGLRSILRQDPDILMVGEIRDTETAEIAIQAALTGHLVFSTIHTTNAPGTLTRLVDMKVEPFLVSSSIIGVLAQRLIRLVCPKCKEAFQPDEKVIKSLGLPSVGNVFTFYRGKGCEGCKGTGFQGRTAIFELMAVNDQIRELIIGRESTAVITQAARKAGMQTLREDGLQKVLKGITTVEEVMRATAEEEK